jgi:hypothetical protein
MSELDLERKLLKESTTLDNIDTYGLNFERSKEILERQDEVYHKWKLLMGIRKAKEKVNEELNSKNIKK